MNVDDTPGEPAAAQPEATTLLEERDQRIRQLVEAFNRQVEDLAKAVARLKAAK